MNLIDHVAIKSSNVAADVERYRQLGLEVETSFDDWGMVRDQRGVGIALIGPGSQTPTHFAIRVETFQELERAAAAKRRPLTHHRDGTISFYTKGAEGVALEFVWYPEKE